MTFGLPSGVSGQRLASGQLKATVWTHAADLAWTELEEAGTSVQVTISAPSLFPEKLIADS
jgi:hypothetical protein